MKKLMLILLATAAMLLVGCSKDKVADSMGYSYSVSVGDWTRPVIDGVSVVSSKNYEMKVGDVRRVSVTPKESSPEPESISVIFSNDCFSWDNEKMTVKAEKKGNGMITVKFNVDDVERRASFAVSISD